MIDPAVFLGQPIQFGRVCKLYPPTVLQVITDESVQRYISLLCQDQDDIDEFIEDHNKNKGTTLKSMSPFSFLMATASVNPNYKALVIDAIKFFTHEENIYILPNQEIIYFGSLEELPFAQSVEDLRHINEALFLDFQNAIRSCIGLKPVEPDQKSDNPIIQRVYDAAKRRRRLAKKARIKNMGNKSSFTTTLTALCCMNIGITPFNVGNLPYAAINPLISTFQRRERYDIDIRTICGGADPKKVRPKYWIKDEDDFVAVPKNGITGTQKTE